MPKPFIDKRKAASFHVVHRSLDESQLEENDPENYYDRYVLPSSTSSSSSSAAAADTAQAPATTTGKYYLQPTSRRHGKSKNRMSKLPSDFPIDLIHKVNDEEAFHPTAVAALKRAYNRRYQLDAESSDPSRLPYEYNYAAHLKSISDSGIFITAGGKIIGDMSEMQQQEQVGSNEHVTEEEIFGEELQQVNTTQIKEVLQTQKKRSRRHERAKLHRDFKLALTDDNGIYDGQWEELEDDFVTAAMTGEDGAESKDDNDEPSDEHRQKRLHDSVFDDIDEEDDEDGFDTAYDDIDAQLNEMKLTVYDTNADYDDEEGEFDELYDSDEDDADENQPANPTRLDTAFDALLHDEYSDDDIGELNPNQYYDGELDGKANLDQYQSVFDEYAGKATDNYINGGARVEINDDETKSVASAHINRLAKQREYTVDEVYEQVNSEYAPKARPQWDAESIVSTYSNIENHPTLIGQSRRKPRPQVVRTDADKQIQLDKHGVPIIDNTTSVSHKLQQLGLNPVGEDDEHDSDTASDMLSSMSIRTNDGLARSKAESTADKKQRKQLAKLQKRLARERKSGTKELFTDAKLAMEKQQVNQRAAWNVGNTIKL